MKNFLARVWDTIRSKAAGLNVTDSLVSVLTGNSRKRVSAAKALSEYIGWAFACIRTIAEAFMGMEVQLFQIGKNNKKQPVLQHPFLDLLRMPNKDMTGLKLLYLLGAHLEATGEAYWLLDGVKNEDTPPTGLIPLNPARMKVLRSSDPRKGIIEFRYTPPTGDDGLKVEEIRYKPYEILYFNNPDPADWFRGVGTTQAIAEWIDADNFAADMNRRYFLNGGKLGGMLETETPMSADNLKFLREQFEAMHKGAENAHRWAVLPKGVKASESSSRKEMDFVESDERQGNKIMAGYRIPRSVLGITDDVNRANAEATDYIFALRNLKPKFRMVMDTISNGLLPRFGDNLLAEAKDPVPENRELAIREMTAATGNQPVMSVNEARERYLQLPPIKNGDSVMTDFTKVPLGAPEKQQQAGGKDHGIGYAARRYKGAQAQLASKIAQAVAQFFTKANVVLPGAFKGVMAKAVVKLSEEQQEAIWKAFAARLDATEKLMVSAVQKSNAVQLEGVLEIIKSAVEKSVRSKGWEADLKQFFEDGKWKGTFSAETLAIQVNLFKTEGQEALTLIGANEVNLLTDEVVTSLREGIDKLIKSYDAKTLLMLETKLAEGFESNASLKEMQALVEGVYNFSDTTRAATVARTETFRIGNQAQKEAWKTSGVVKTVSWYTSADERVCPLCASMHGKTISVDEDFLKDGDTVTGTDGSTYDVTFGDVGNPPLHPLCRCGLLVSETTLD